MGILKYFLISHFIGDFYLQNSALVKKKKDSIWWLLLHTAIYTLMFVVSIILFGNLLEIIICSSTIFISHFLIDFFRIKIIRKSSCKALFWSFVIDQILHIMILIIISLIINPSYNLIGEALVNSSLWKIINVDFEKLLLYILAFSIILIPSSVFIKHLFNCLFNNIELCENENSDNVGSLIGMFERVLILLLGILKLYGSIAIVLTAKSIARFKQLEDKKFAEKYIVGTLISLIISLVALFIII